jgi:hypothetical protein
MFPVVYETGEIKNNRFHNKYQIGEYEFPLQVDIWARTKEERFRLEDEFLNAFSADFPIHGLSLVLERYHDVNCKYDMIDTFTYPDDEGSSQRREWRAKIDLVANCKAIHELDEFAMVTTEIESEIYEDKTFTEDE